MINPNILLMLYFSSSWINKLSICSKDFSSVINATKKKSIRFTEPIQSLFAIKVIIISLLLLMLSVKIPSYEILGFYTQIKKTFKETWICSLNTKYWFFFLDFPYFLIHLKLYYLLLLFLHHQWSLDFCNVFISRYMLQCVFNPLNEYCQY